MTVKCVPESYEDRKTHRSRMHGKAIVFVSPGYPGKRFIFEKAHELGVKSIVIDSPGSWVKGLEESGLVDTVLEVDMAQDDDSVFIACVEALERMPKIDGICTFVELSAPLTARLCERFDVPGHSVNSVTLARDKHLTRKAINSTDSTSKYAIKNYLIKEGTEAELITAAAHVGFPAVLKPVSGAASLGVQKVTSFEELLRTYSIISELVGDLVVSSGALERRVRLANTHESESESTEASAEPFHSNLSSLSNTLIALEEYISGQEVDIDMVLCDGEITFCEISDNGPTVEPYFGETFNCCPSLLPTDQQDLLRTMAYEITVDALGFKSGVFHVEAKMSPHGPRLIEVNCRMGGGPIRAVHLARSGVDLVEEQLLVSAGYHSTPPSIPEGDRLAVGFIDVNASKSGSVNTLSFLDGIESRPGILYSKPFVFPGEHIIGPEEGQPTWLLEAVLTRHCPNEAYLDAQDLYVEVQKLFEANYV